MNGLYWFTCLFLFLTYVFASNYQNVEDNEFAEFEEFEADEELLSSKQDDSNFTEAQQHGSNEGFISDDDDQDAIVSDESEFEHFQDTDEFEGFADGKDEKADSEPKITITKVPMHFRSNWDSYWLEILMIVGLVCYFINFATGKSKNSLIASNWFQAHKQLLEENFSLVGDDKSLEHSNETGGLIKESENIFTLWCSGRTCCEGMLVELKLIKRQDLVAIIAGMMRPTMDQIHVKVMMDADSMDTFVCCLAQKRTAIRLSKDMADLSVYCPERRAGDKYNLSNQFQVMSEISEATNALLLSSKVVTILNKYPDYVDYIHISDQYSGPKQTEDTANALKLPDVQKVLIFVFNITVKGVQLTEAMEIHKHLMNMVLYMVDKVKRLHLTKEGKSKAEKNRQRVEDAFLKSTHATRAEAAATRREEKRRIEKEKIMAEDDPERQRRWEEKEQKRLAKKRAPKMKQLKVKAL